MTRFSVVAVFVAVIVLLVGIGWTASQTFVPHCPHEDSCEIDYRDGRWFLDDVAVSQ